MLYKSPFLSRVRCTYNNFCFIIYFSFINFVSCSLSLIFTLCDFCVPINYIFKRLYITLYITFSQNLSKTLPPASAVISSRAFSEKLNQKFVNIPHTKWVKNNAILRFLGSASLFLYIYQYGEDVKHQYHIVWNYQHLYFEIYDFFISVVYKIYVCTNKKKYISLPHRSFSHFHIIYFDWRSISLLHILKQ